MSGYNRRIFELVRQEMPVAKDGGVVLPALVLSSAAKSTWVEFFNHVEGSSGEGKELEPVRGFAQKIGENAVRIAGVLTVVAGGQVIQEQEMSDAIYIAEHYLAEALRLFQSSRVQRDLQVAQRALRWIKEQDDSEFSLPDLYQRGPRPIHDKATAIKIVSILEDHGYLDKVDGGKVINEVFRRDVWRLATGVKGNGLHQVS
jgi:hypothetical protein